MKQYTTPEQTAKLIELGFEKPKSIVDKYYDFDTEDYIEVNHYSIGELIEMLPSMIAINDTWYGLRIIADSAYCWSVSYEPADYDRGRVQISKIFDGGSCLLDVLYRVLVTLVEDKGRFSDFLGHDEYYNVSGSEIKEKSHFLSRVFATKEELLKSL